jgi:hypothetical protein
MEKIALEKEHLKTAIKTALQEHYHDMKMCAISDEHIDTLFHLFTNSIIECIEDQNLKMKG